MTLTTLFALATCLVVLAATYRRLEATVLTAPMVAVALGIIVGDPVLGLAEFRLDDELIVGLTEATLATLLFADAATIDARKLRRFLNLPVRLLLIGLPLTIALGSVMTQVLLPGLTWAEAALIAVMLTPTDAALGQAVITNPAVPLRIRETLDVESGLNDGLVVPLFVAASLLAEGDDVPFSEVAAEVARSVGIGAATGVVVGAAGGWLFAQSSAAGWSSAASQRIGALALVALSYVGALELGGNAFIACFVAGLSLRTVGGEAALMWRELTEDIGIVGSFAVFVLFGATFVEPALDALSLAVVVCALGALTVGRMLPTAVALVGSGLKAPTVAFVGWFGPRGLASVLFGLLLISESEMESGTDFFSLVTLVVLASVFLHGLTAAPLSRRYGEWFAAQDDATAMSEAMPASITPSRRHRGPQRPPP